jgi:ABC-type Na+ efflux pump permease subunit
MVWKEIAEVIGNRRSLRVFAIAVVAMGILPSLTSIHSHGAVIAGALVLLVRSIYVLFAAAIVVANTAPDLVLHERVGRTLDYLIATRLSDASIFAGKVLVAAAVGYVAALVATGIQLLFSGLVSGQGWTWLYLASPIGRILALGVPAALALYIAVIGTFVALRVGDQRSAYLVTMLSLGVIVVPLILGWIPIQLTTAWFGHAALIFGGVAIVLGIVGRLLFRRDMLVLYLQE